MPFYRKKPVVIEARKFGFSYKEDIEIAKWCNGTYVILGEERCIYIETLEGRMVANYGDYIIKGIKGEFYPCKPDIFTDTYDALT